MAENNPDNSIVSPIQMTDIGKDLTHLSSEMLKKIAEQSKASSAIVITAGIGEPIPIHIATYQLTNPAIVMSIIIALESWLDEHQTNQ
jgi:hypothetical protein